jgi:hypothetical protein
MQIDRSNYEIWIIDWLDGNLNDIEVTQLQLFLHKNPDIKEEYDELTLFRLSPSEELFHQKKNLKKTTATLPESQFEYLCVASLENDLSSEQLAELKEIIDADPSRKTIFDLIQKTKLIPSEHTYKHKNRLYRSPFAQNLIRISAIGLSAAAIIAFVILNYVLKPELLPVNPVKTSQTIIPLNKIQEPTVTKVPEKNHGIEKKQQPGKNNKDLMAISDRLVIPENRPDSGSLVQPDSMIRGTDSLNPIINKVHVSFNSVLSDESLSNDLITLNHTRIVPPFDDGRSRLGRFIAKTVREKLLKEKTPEDSPLKGYEIAEAGVSGLNKLLGWEMALDEKKDKNGELESVYFSSRILKFNAPVRKTEPRQ